MKILVQTPLKNEEIKALLCNAPLEGMTFSFSGKQGIAMVFEANGGTADQVISVAEAAIKAADWGKVLYFTVTNG